MTVSVTVKNWKLPWIYLDYTRFGLFVVTDGGSTWLVPGTEFEPGGE